MPFAAVNGVCLYWEAHGESGDPLVLVHGSWGDHHNWDAVLPGLARSFRVVTYDRRGHSQSERLAGQGSVREDVADLAALMEQLRITPAHVVGNSFGASITLRLAGTRPELFRSVIAHEPPLFATLAGEPSAQPALAEVGTRIAKVLELLHAGDMADGARRFVETIAFGPGAWDQLPAELRETFTFNAPTWLDETGDPEALAIDLASLGAFRKPALLSNGDQSPPFFQLVLTKLGDALPHAQRSTFVGAGHVPHLSHPQEYVRIVTDFGRASP